MVLLFSYGTLQDRDVQVANFGPELTGRADALPGYARRLVPISDKDVAAALRGESYYANAQRSPIRKMRFAGRSSKSRSKSWRRLTNTKKTLSTPGFPSRSGQALRRGCT